MFKVGKHISLGALHRIVSNRVVLADDDGLDFIYSGTNNHGNRVLGVVIAGIEDGGNSYFHVLIDDPMYVNYLNQEVTFLDILKASDVRFVVSFDRRGNELDHSWITLEDVPVDYMPREKSFCPKFDRSPSLVFSASLKGQLADAHKAVPEAANAMAGAVVKMMRRSTDFLALHLKVEREILQIPAKAASYEIGFEVMMSSPNAIGLEGSRIAEYLSNYYQYIFRGVLQEGVASEQNISPSVLNLEDGLNGIYRGLERMVMPAPDLRVQLVRSINDSIRAFNEIPLGEGFDYMTFANDSTTGAKVPIGVVDEAYMETIVRPIVKKAEPIEPVKDEVEREYRIEVRGFNIDNGTGRANLIIGFGKSEERLPINIKAKGREKGSAYHQTVLTESEDKGSRVTVMAKAIRKGGVIERLEIELPD